MYESNEERYKGKKEGRGSRKYDGIKMEGMRKEKGREERNEK